MPKPDWTRMAFNKNNKKLTARHREQYDKYAAHINTYVGEYGEDGSEYLRHNRLMQTYHRGAADGIEELMGNTDKKTVWEDS